MKRVDSFLEYSYKTGINLPNSFLDVLVARSEKVSNDIFNNTPDKLNQDWTALPPWYLYINWLSLINTKSEANINT